MARDRGRGQGTGRRRGYARRSKWQPLALRAAIVAGGVVLLVVIANGLGLLRPSAGVVMPDQGGGHIPEGQSVSYNSIPPTSGSHWLGTASWGAHTERVPDERVVHNLEHGGIAIAYNGIDQAAIDRLKGFLVTFPRSRFGSVKLVIHPDERLRPGEIVLTAWARMDRLDRLDEARIRTFYEAHLERCCEQQP